MIVQQGRTSRRTHPSAGPVRPARVTGYSSTSCLWTKDPRGTRGHRTGKEGGWHRKSRAVRIPSLSVNPREREVRMPECDLCQADGATEDEAEAEESEPDDCWMSDEMSLSEGEISGGQPKR